MRGKFLELNGALHEYVVERGARQDEVLRAVERETAALGDIAVMQVSPDEGALLTLLTRAVGARRAVEIGTFTGYSAICIARGLPADGELLCCEVSERWAGVARENLRRAGVAERIDVRVGDALETLRALPAEEAFDLAFVDADKPGYAAYYEEVLARLRPGGLILLDNVLLGGRAAAAGPDDEAAAAMDRLNAAIAADGRVDCAMLTVADGLTLARKR